MAKTTKRKKPRLMMDPTNWSGEKLRKKGPKEILHNFKPPKKQRRGTGRKK
jgi:hypothetical protein